MEGKKLPAVTFTDVEGRKVKSSELETPAVLYVYPEDDTEGCTAEACGIRDRWADFRKAGLRVYGFSPDDAKSHKKFSAKYGLPHTLLTADQEALERLGVWQEKQMFGRRYMGVVRQTWLIGADGKVLKHYPRVTRPENHAGELLADYEALSG